MPCSALIPPGVLERAASVQARCNPDTRGTRTLHREPRRLAPRTKSDVAVDKARMIRLISLRIVPSLTDIDGIGAMDFYTGRVLRIDLSVSHAAVEPLNAEWAQKVHRWQGASAADLWGMRCRAESIRGRLTTRSS